MKGTLLFQTVFKNILIEIEISFYRREKFTNCEDILQMAKSIVYFFPSAGSFMAKTSWVSRQIQ